MRITFCCMGWENLGIEALSAALKHAGHKCNLAYDQALFDDKNYLCIPWLAKLFDQKKKVVQRVIDSRPDLVAFSCYTINYPWALNMAREIKKKLDVPIIFGNVHVSSVPEHVIKEDAIDMICLWEGEEAMVELANSMENGSVDHNIRNIWFKLEDGTILRNDCRVPVKDLDILPHPDKELFEKEVPIKNYYLAALDRGCVYACNYCAVSVAANEYTIMGGKRYREPSVGHAIRELKVMKERYNYDWIDFRHSVFSASTKWVIDFCERYKKEVNVPFRIFYHPKLVNDKTVKALKGAGCFAVQMGLESFDERLRNEILNRKETNEQIVTAVNIMEEHKLKYSLDYILGLPGQVEKELEEAAKFFVELRHCFRISSFMFQYLPKTKMVDIGLSLGLISNKDVADIESGRHGNYMSDGSQADTATYKMFSAWKIFFRMLPYLPIWMKKTILKYKLYKIFKYLPQNLIIKMLDLVIVIRDIDARTYVKNYIWWTLRRLRSDY